MMCSELNKTRVSAENFPKKLESATEKMSAQSLTNLSALSVKINAELRSYDVRDRSIKQYRCIDGFIDRLILGARTCNTRQRRIKNKENEKVKT